MKRTAIYHRHVADGATIVERDGWQLPARYTSVEAEVKMVRTAGGICDISPTGKLDAQGADALSLLSRALSLAETLKVGWTQRCSMSTAEGDTIDDVNVAGLSYDEAIVLTPAARTRSAAAILEERLNGCAHLIDVTSTRAGLWLVGPHSHRVLSKLAELDLDPTVFPDGRCVQGKAAEVHVLVIRSDILGLLAYQVYVTRDYGEYLWDALLHAGHRDGVGPFGIEALDQLGLGA